ncbi:MAG: ATP-binding protein [Planctomycetes bacterium]|nr:ATP-binding protein [Planctomycetota bacterium]
MKTTEKFLRLLPLGRRIMLMVGMVSLTLALFLQVVGMLVVQSHIEEGHRQASATAAALLAPNLERNLKANDTQAISDLFASVRQANPDINYLAVCSPDGSQIYALTGAEASGDLADLVRDRSTSHPSKSMFNVRTERGDVLHLIQPLGGGEQGYLHVGFSWVPVDKAVRHVCISLLAAVLCGLGLSIGVAWLGFSRLARPIVSLVEAVKEFGGGRLSVRVERTPGAHDEADLLSGAFNEMANRLEQQVEDLVKSHSALSVEKARVQAVLDSLAPAIVVVGEDAQIVYCNRAAADLNAQTCQVSGVSYRTLRAGQPKALAAFEKVVSGQAPTQRFQSKVEGRDLDVTISRVSGADGTCVGIVEVARDVTQQLQSWRALAHAEKLNVVGQLTAVVAHEINSPLDGAIEASRIIERSASEPEKVRQFAHAQRSGLERIAAFVRRLLNFSRVPGGSEWAHVQVAKFLEEARALLHHRLSRVKLVIEPEIPLDLVVRGDELGLVQVMVNLINNAVDATPAGGTVKVSAVRENGRVLIKVVDQGPGIPDVDAGKLFASFFTTKEVGKGTGLGLVVSRNIAQEHGGDISFENLSKPWGACFTVILPSDALPNEGARRTGSVLESVGGS